MAHIERAVHIAAPVEAVYDYASTVAAIPEWYTSMIEVRNASTAHLENGTKYDWTFKMAGVRFDGRAEYLEVVPNKRTRSRTEGGIPSLWEFHFVPEGGGCRVDVSVEYTVPGSLLGKIADKLFIERLNERDLEHALANLKAHCEAAKAVGARA